jgi:phenylacetate-CoA ligase
MIYTLADIFASQASPDSVARMFRNTPQSIQKGVAAHRFRRTIRYAATHSPFYRRAFKEHGIDPLKVRTPADLKDLYTTPQDLSERAEEFICDKPSIVFESSGTSGVNKRVYFSEHDLKVVGTSAAAGLLTMGVTREDRVANAFDFSIWCPGMVCHYGLTAGGIFSQAVGKCDPIEVWRRMDQYKFTVLFGEPTWLIRLTEIAEREGGGKLKMMVGGAEEIPVAAREWMSKVWNGAYVKMAYAAVENASGLGFQPCSNHDGYHLDTADFCTEIVDQDADGYGEIVFTTLVRRTMPLIRYRTKDVAKFLPECTCGLKGARISRIHGRRDELVVASGGNLYPLMFDRILHDVPGLTHDWQIVFKLEGVREVLDINIETTRTDVQAIEAEIHKFATELYPDLMKNLALGIFEMRVTARQPGTIRTRRKLKRLVDKRHFDLSDEVPDDGEPDIVDAAANGKVLERT